MGEFYYHFAAAYGTIWFALLLLALITQKNINTGQFGLIGFPVLSLIYAAIVVSNKNKADNEKEDLQRKISEIEQRLSDLKNMESIYKDRP